jgi:hypothetical protein
MDAIEAIKKLEAYAPFKEFIKINKDSYLVHAFTMIEDASSKLPIDSWQIGYYDDKKDRITIFDVGKKITQSPDSEVFKKDKTIKRLDIKKISFELEKALELTNKTISEKYPTEIVSKKIILLQNIKEGTLWNITYVTMRFNVFNLKIDASSGEIVHTSFESLLLWKK